MILAYLLLLTGLTISSVAIYYSVVGLTAIFSAAAIPIMIMGVSLEVAKLVCATWIKQNWVRVPKLMKIYMCIAVAVLMLITSMGIFGFLSKAHNDQNLVSGDVQSKIAIYDEKIKTAKDNIDVNRKVLEQMDASVDQTMGRSSDEKGADKAVALRKSQAKERSRILAEITAEQKTISQLNDEAAPIRAEVRKVDAEVGPIKYIAAFLYGTTPDASMLEKAVTWIIILIVIVFDPLAVIMLLASQMTFAWEKKQEEELPTPEEIEEPPVIWGGFVMNPSGKEVEETNELAPIAPTIDIDDVNAMLEEAKEEPEFCPYVPYQNLVDALKEQEEEYPFRGKGEIPSVPMTASYIHNIKLEPEVIDFETQDPETAKGAEVETLPELPEYVNPNAPGLDASIERPGDYLKEAEQSVPSKNLEAAPARGRGVMHTHLQADNAPTLEENNNRSDFGSVFPTAPLRGDTYLRTDTLPNRLYKWNGLKWIEIDKNSTDIYAYNEMYIEHLIEQINAGSYDIDTLSDVEREQIKHYLSKNAQ